MRFRERLRYLIVNILPTVSFLITLYLYRRQQQFYEQRILSLGSVYDGIVDGSDVDMTELENNLTFVSQGGLYEPGNCTCHLDKKVAIIIPFRERHQHLGVFLKYMHLFLKKQGIYYRIFIIEQANKGLFNRGKLLNIGFTETSKIDNFNCIVFHDIDLLPLSGGNEYFCPESPRHMSIAVDTMDFRKPYEDIFGGVSAIFPEQFKAVNGYPNRYWGWGGEDDDLSERSREPLAIIKARIGYRGPRLKAAGYKISTHNAVNGMYKMLDHHHSISEEFDDRYNTLRKWEEQKDKDGLSTLQYEVLKRKDYKLYTLISCNI